MAESKAPEAPKTVTMDIDEPITISNVQNSWHFPKGQNVEVPAELADEVRRINSEHLRYKASLLTKQEYIVNSGTMAVGGGAQ